MQQWTDLKRNPSQPVNSELKRQHQKQNKKKPRGGKENSPLSFMFSPACLLSEACLSQLLLNKTRCNLGSLGGWGICVEDRGDFCRQKMEFKLFFAGFSMLSCRGGSSSGQSTQVPPSLFGLSPPLAFRKAGGERVGGEQGFPVLSFLKMPFRSHRTQSYPGSKEFCREPSPIRSREVKSAPKGNFNCLTRLDFLRGGSAGREKGGGRQL